MIEKISTPIMLAIWSVEQSINKYTSIVDRSKSLSERDRNSLRINELRTQREMLKSFLPIEKEMLKQMYESKPWTLTPSKGKPNGFYDSRDVSFEEYFDEKFKNYE